MSYEEIQRIQAEYRRRLADGWGISVGAKVLEIGCGQGDMTALLAQAVGPTGHVTAVDIADREYGAPLTLGQATDLLKATPEGGRIDFRFEFDVLDPQHAFEVDDVVLAHSSWYFASLDQLKQTLVRARKWGKRLCFAEWDLQPRSLEQVAHLLAVVIQGEVEAFKPTSLANIRTPFSRTRFKTLLGETGWTLVEEQTVETDGLQDADWEIQACLRSSVEEAPPELAAWVEAQVEVLNELAVPSGNRPLNSYSILAE